MTPMDAATIAMNYVVAHILLFDLGGLSAGKTVLLHSAAGGVVSKISDFFFIDVLEGLLHSQTWLVSDVASYCTCCIVVEGDVWRRQQRRIHANIRNTHELTFTFTNRTQLASYIYHILRHTDLIYTYPISNSTHTHSHLRLPNII